MLHVTTFRFSVAALSCSKWLLSVEAYNTCVSDSGSPPSSSRSLASGYWIQLALLSRSAAGPGVTSSQRLSGGKNKTVCTCLFILWNVCAWTDDTQLFSQGADDCCFATECIVHAVCIYIYIYIYNILYIRFPCVRFAFSFIPSTALITLPQFKA